jgi:hypothetical protein
MESFWAAWKASSYKQSRARRTGRHKENGGVDSLNNLWYIYRCLDCFFIQPPSNPQRSELGPGPLLSVLPLLAPVVAHELRNIKIPNVTNVFEIDLAIIFLG